MWKNSNVVILATNEKTKLLLSDNTLFESDNSFTGIRENIVKERESYQHLYITSNEEIKADDWCIDIWNGDVVKMDSATKNMLNSGMLHNPHSKIIATTDTSLKIHKFDKGVFKDLTYSLPQIPQQFIQQYIGEYNKDNVITKIEVEYDFADHDLALFRNEITLKVNPDNTINIKPIKNSWSKEEVIDLLYDAIHYSKGKVYSHDLEWIKENL